MAKWKLSFVLLLQLTMCFSSEVTLVKTLSGKPDVTPICGNEALQNITLIVCKIRTERNRGEECRLLYQRREQSFEQNCDSRFTLRTENQTVVLHLSSLTPVDSGNYTCECAHPDGASTLHLMITVEEDEDPINSTYILIGITIFIIMTAVITVFIYRGTRHRRRLETLNSSPNLEPEAIEPYSTFIERENVLYSTVRLHDCYTNTST